MPTSPSSQALLAEMQKITPTDDAKLQHLKTQILSKLASPINPGNRKVLIFTAFADTANYLYEHLAPQLLKATGIHTARRDRRQHPQITLGKGYDFQSLLTLFSPRSKEKADHLPRSQARLTFSSRPIAFPKARTSRTATTSSTTTSTGIPSASSSASAASTVSARPTPASSSSTTGPTSPSTSTSTSKSASRTAWSSPT